MSANDIAMLAARDCDPEKLRYPLYGSVKLDGIRCLIRNRTAMSRSNIPLPNIFLQMWAASDKYEHMDGELIVGRPTSEDVYNTTQSAISTRSGTPDFRYYVFDYTKEERKPYGLRYDELKWRLASMEGRVVLVEQRELHNPEEVKEYYRDMLDLGFEGLILRCGRAPYKRGRGTLRAQDLMKLKPRERAEAVVIGFEELMHNANDAFVGERGQTKRSHHQENMVPMNTLGAFIVKDLETGVQFRVGSFRGVTANDKQLWWYRQVELINKVLVYEYSKIGTIDKPRQPVWVGWRESFDL